MRYISLAGLVLLFTSTVCFADGDCPDRPATAQERAAYSAAHAAALAAVPAAPRDWLRNDESDAKTAELLPDCPGGTADAPHRYRFTFKYKFDHATRIAAQNAAFADAARGTPEQQARLAALDAESDKLKEERKQARKRGDQAAVDRIKDRLDRIRDERRTLDREISDAYTASVQSGEMTRAMQAGVPKRDEAELVVHINEDKVWAPRPTTEPVSVAGAEHACWRANDRGSLVILLGTWNRDGSMFKARLPRGAVTTKPRTVVVEIAAERPMAEKLAREIRLDSLKAQLR